MNLPPPSSKRRTRLPATLAALAVIASCRLPSYSGADGGAGGPSTDGGPGAPGVPCRGDSECASGLCGSNGRCSAATCSDGMKNQGESDIDCGGVFCDPCDNTRACSDRGDCRSASCVEGTCRAPTCSDGVKNGQETAQDCGGPCATSEPVSKCAATLACGLDADCASSICRTGTCQPPACLPTGDQVQNGAETDLDCGGPGCSPCADGKMCEAGTDCASGVCTSGRCAVPTCVPADLVKNGTETDLDCGGLGCPACAASKSCAASSDCTSGVCTGAPKACQAPTCPDGVKNQGETDVDCGGAACSARCSLGKACTIDTDCATGFCIGGTCKEASCTDGRRNGLETDIDCGGATCRAAPKLCIAGQTCGVSEDCAGNGKCEGSKCLIETCSNRIKDTTNESDTDCGGPFCARCTDGKICGIGSDCASGVCSASKTCQPSSCTPADGVRNGTETDIDCGGTGCPKCADTKACGSAADCASGVCSGGFCQAPKCSPPDSVTNGGETDVDCGGPQCSVKCADGKACTASADCVNTVCLVSAGVGATSIRNTCPAGICTGGSCRTGSCTDGLWGGSETDVDCGGDCPSCAVGKKCNQPTDCVNGGACKSGVCSAPTCSDGRQNQGETDIDCGGTQTPACSRCGVSSQCAAASDCMSGICTDKKCSPLKLAYYELDNNASDPQVYPYLRLTNKGTVAIPYNQVKIRYWFNKDGSTNLKLDCFGAPGGCGQMPWAFQALSPARSGADYYLELSFSGANSLAPNADSGDIGVRFYHDGWTVNFNETAHYSYGAYRSYTDWDRVTVYWNGARVWGNEPQ